MMNRRDFFGIAAGAGASMALTPALLRAIHQSSGNLIQRAIPSSGEMLPAVGLSFSNHVGCSDPVALKEVLKTFAENGGRLFDAMHGGVEAQEFHIAAATELGIQDKLFWSLRSTPGGPPQPGPAKTQIDALRSSLKVSSIDLVMTGATSDQESLDLIKTAKKEGRVRYIGVQSISDHQYDRLEARMRSEPIDFIGVDYDMGNRARVEDSILPLALERKIGVMAFFPFGSNGGVSCGGGVNLFGRVASTPLPEWAADFDAKTWAQFFLKYVISHPAVTVARVGTTKPKHMLDNISGGIGRLPDEATRKRMAALIDSLPAIVPIANLDRYVGQFHTAAGTVFTFRREGATLFVKSGSSAEVPLIPRSWVRFSDPRGPVFEFQLVVPGPATGVIMEDGNPIERITLTRK